MFIHQRDECGASRSRSRKSRRRETLCLAGILPTGRMFTAQPTASERLRWTLGHDCAAGKLAIEWVSKTNAVSLVNAHLQVSPRIRWMYLGQRILEPKVARKLRVNLENHGWMGCTHRTDVRGNTRYEGQNLRIYSLELAKD